MESAKRIEDLVAWQLAAAVRDAVFDATEVGTVSRDRAFCDDIRRAAQSAPANIAEGFGRYDPKPNANFVSIAKGSLEEIRNHSPRAQCDDAVSALPENLQSRSGR